jgi:hypothetical protein
VRGCTLQLPKQSIYLADTPVVYRDMQNASMNDIDKMDDNLPLLNNHYILESIVMKSVAPLSENSMSRLTPAAYYMLLLDLIRYSWKINSYGYI